MLFVNASSFPFRISLTLHSYPKPALHRFPLGKIRISSPWPSPIISGAQSIPSGIEHLQKLIWDLDIPFPLLHNECSIFDFFHSGGELPSFAPYKSIQAWAVKKNNSHPKGGRYFEYRVVIFWRYWSVKTLCLRLHRWCGNPFLWAKVADSASHSN